MRAVVWMGSVVAVVIVAGCVEAASRQSDVASAVDRYLALPRDIDRIVGEAPNEAGARAAVRKLLAEALSDPLLTRLTQWFATVEFAGEAVSDLLESIRPVGPRGPHRIVEMTSSRAVAETDITVVETYGLGYNLATVRDLFQRYPIANERLDDIARRVATSGDPDALSFEVSSSKRLRFSLKEVDNEWRVAEVTETVTASTLRLIP